MPDEFRLTEEDLGPPKKSSKKLIIISAVLVGILALGALGYFGWKKYSGRQKQLDDLKTQIESLKEEAEKLNIKEDQFSTESVAQNNIEESNNEQEIDEYIGWKTYTNYDVGYVLRYPTDWTVKETDTVSELTDEYVKYITIYDKGKKYFVFWGLKRKDDDFQISDRTGVGAGDFIKEGEITILDTKVAANKLVYQGKIKEYFFPSPGLESTSDGIYQFSAALSGNSSSADLSAAEQVDIARRILQSVKIIARKTECESTLSSADKLAIKTWKTYKSDKYDYSFKHPADWTLEEDEDNIITFSSSDGSFQWRSEEMANLGFEGWDIDTTKNLKVACQSAKSTYLKQGDGRMIFTRFKKGGKEHMTSFSYKYLGASLSSDMVEMYGLILKSAEFK
jgi:hypothetical protein